MYIYIYISKEISIVIDVPTSYKETVDNNEGVALGDVPDDKNEFVEIEVSTSYKITESNEYEYEYEYENRNENEYGNNKWNIDEIIENVTKKSTNNNIG